MSDAELGQDKEDFPNKSDEDWQRELSPQQYRILRQKGTEAPFTGKYWNEHAAGVYRCAMRCAGPTRCWCCAGGNAAGQASSRFLRCAPAATARWWPA